MATFTTTFTLTAAAGSMGPSALSISKTATEGVNKDSSASSFYVSASETQTVYKPTDLAANIPPVCYIYIAATTSGSTGGLDIKYTSGSVVTTVSNLKNGDWIYLPFKTVAVHPDSSSLSITNTTSFPASAYVVYAESGSL